MSGIPGHYAAASTPLLIDVFCQVVDNYGDIGVCWRLARRLTEQTPHQVRLWVDNLTAFQHLEPRVNNSGQQTLSSQITAWHWKRIDEVSQAGDVVIEAFGCHLPEAFLPLMVEKNSLWINLEYLSAQDWVNDCHGLPSLQANGLRKYFFFPGFTPSTGGLLREPDLLSRRDRWLATPNLRWAQLEQLGVSTELCNMLRNGGRQVFLFNYPGAPVNALVHALASDSTPTIILQPHRGGPSMSLRAPNVFHVNIPFVPQAHFDTLLWGSDLNLVRGEDSLVRATWAGKPFIWHIYPQANDAHLAKLSAWLDKSPFDTHIKQLQMTWNQANAPFCQSIFAALIAQAKSWQAWQTSCHKWASELVQQPDLAENLLSFFTLHAGKR
jgi:uncharacterized repeat protein (TIGR03837 family)